MRHTKTKRKFYGARRKRFALSASGVVRFAPRRNPAQEDVHAAHELVLFIENDGQLYRQQTQPIIENLAKKKAKGVYSIEPAKKLWGYLAESGAKKYAKQFSVGTDWHVMFSTGTRRLAAADLEEGFREQVFERAKEIAAARAAKKVRKPRPNRGKLKSMRGKSSKARAERRDIARLRRIAASKKPWPTYAKGRDRHAMKVRRKARVTVGTKRGGRR